MRFILLTLSLSFSLNVFAQDPFTVPKEEINKKGLYTIEQPGIPFHEDYEEIYRHNSGRKLSKDPTGKFFILKFEKARFKIFVPETYNPNTPAGIVFLDVRNAAFDKNFVDTNLKYTKEFFKHKNLICVLINTEVPDMNIRGKNTLEYGHEFAVLVRRSIDIVKERYKIDSDRVLLFSCSEVDPVFMATVCCPKVFKYNSFIGTPMFFYDNMPSPNGGKEIPSFGSQDQAITTLKAASKNKYLFYHAYVLDDKVNLKMETQLNRKSEGIFKRNNFNKTEFFDITYKGIIKDKNELKNKIIFEHQYELILDALTKLDPNPFDAKNFLIQAQKFEKQNNTPKAFENYKMAALFGFEEATEKFEIFNKELIEKSTLMMKEHVDKNYPAAFQLATEILKKFGTVNSNQAASIYKTYSNDKKINLEIKAAAFLSKAEAAALLPNPPVDKIKAACEKVIQTVPGTKTAVKAQKIIDEFK